MAEREGELRDVSAGGLRDREGSALRISLGSELGEIDCMEQLERLTSGLYSI